MASDALIARLKAALNASQPVAALQVHFINLDAVRERYGARWPQTRTRVFDAMQGFLERRLAQGDLLMRAGDGFLVFPDPDSHEAPEAFAVRIEAELKAFFLGTKHLKDIEIGVSAVQVSPEELLRTIERGAKEAEDAAPRGRAARRDARPETDGPRFDLVFMPVWSAASSTLALFAATPIETNGSGRVVDPGGSREAAERLDHAVLARLAQAVTARDAQGSGAVAAPVAYSTLADAARRVGYLGALRDLDPAVSRRLVLRVVGTPSDAPATVLNQALRMTRPCAAHLAVDLTAAGPHVLTRYSGGSADIFTFAAPVSADAMAARLDAYRVAVRDAERLGARVWVTNCRSPESGRTALAAGAQFLSGGAIAKPGPHPGPVRTISLNPARATS